MFTGRNTSDSSSPADTQVVAETVAVAAETVSVVVAETVSVVVAETVSDVVAETAVVVTEIAIV